jgi:hypothetical protein
MKTANQNNTSECTLGGITIRITSEPSSIQVDSVLTEADISFYFSSSKRCLVSDGNIRVHCALSKEEYSHSQQAQISFRQCSTFYATAEGCLEMSKMPDDKLDSLWSVTSDPEFCRFDYLLSPYASRKIPLHALATNIFLLQHSFISHQGLVIHAGGGSIQGKGMVFAAPSGTGKSTLTQLLLSSPQNRLFSEERLIIRLVDADWNVWGTPWSGENNIARNESAPLSALVFLSQSEKTKITELTPSAGLHRLLQVVSIPWYSEEWTNKGLAVCESLIQDIPMFELAFRPDQSAVQAVEELASGL